MFARMKRQGAAGKWEWLWTYDDDPREVAADVQAWEAKGYRTSNSFGGNRDAKPPKRDSKTPGQTMLVKPEDGDGAVSGKPVDGESMDGQPVDGEPRNKESLSPPSEEETSTGQIYTHTSREHEAQAAAPPCVDDPPTIEFPDEILDPDVAAANWAKRSKASTQVSDRYNRTAHLPASEPIVERFARKCLVQLSNEETGAWRKAVSKLLKLGYTDRQIDAGLAVCLAERCGPWLLERKTMGIVNAARAPKRASTDIKFEQNMARHQAMTGGAEDPADVAASLFPAVAAASRAQREELENSTNHPSSTTRALPRASA